jgi:hypothetical protein
LAIAVKGPGYARCICARLLLLAASAPLPFSSGLTWEVVRAAVTRSSWASEFDSGATGEPRRTGWGRRGGQQAFSARQWGGALQTRRSDLGMATFLSGLKAVSAKA